MSDDLKISAIVSKDYHPVTHVIFDCDGLLVNSEIYYSKAISAVATKYGKTFDFSIKVAMMGTKPIEGAVIFLKMLGLTGKLSPEDFVTEYETEMKKNYHEIGIVAWRQKTDRALQSEECTYGNRNGISPIWFREKNGPHWRYITQAFSHHVFAGSDPEVKRGKPYPDVFLVAAKRFRDPPKDMKSVLVFEDAVNGVMAARAAGMQVVLVPDSRLLRIDSAVADLSKCKPTEILSSLLDFQPDLFGLPKFT